MNMEIFGMMNRDIWMVKAFLVFLLRKYLKM